MGMFDDVIVDEKVRKYLETFIDGPLKEDITFQTKDLECLMEQYYLAYDANNDMRLYFLDKPTDKEKFWHDYTDEEIYEDQRKNALRKVKDEEEGKKHFWLPSWEKKKGEGRWMNEAWDPENRNKRHMGEMPHKHISMYSSYGEKDEWLEFSLKFTDGVCVKVEKV